MTKSTKRDKNDEYPGKIEIRHFKFFILNQEVTNWGRH